MVTNQLITHTVMGQNNVAKFLSDVHDVFNYPYVNLFIKVTIT